MLPLPVYVLKKYVTSLFQVDKNLSFLNSFVQQSIEKGARPYLPESERSATFNVENFRGQYRQETSAHSLRFEAYELPKPAPVTKVPTASSLSTPTAALVPVPEPAYLKDTHQPPNLPSIPDVLSLSTDVGVKLRLDGVQKKWGRPTYSTSAALPSSSTSATQKTANGISHLEVGGSVDLRRTNQQAEVPAEKQKLVASLFGSSSSSSSSSSKTEKKPRPSTHKTVKGSHKRSTSSESAKEKPAAVVNSTLPPDLLDLDEPAPGISTTIDPFSQLEGLLEPNSASTSPLPSFETKAPDLMSLFNDTTNNKNSHGGVMEMMTTKKGPNPQDSLEKDAVARQVGVTPTGNNPNLFRDLFS